MGADQASLNEWAIRAAAAFASEKHKRNATSQCLAALRKRGLIN